MQFSYLFGPAQILTQLQVQDKWELIDRMLEAIQQDPAIEDVPDSVRATFRESVLERESEISTGLGEGVAFPHARIPELNRIFISIAVLSSGIDYGSPDGAPVQFACLALLPETKPTAGLKIMSACTQLLSDPSVREFFASEEDWEKIYAYIDEQDIKIDAPVTAGDLMRPPKVRITPDLPLRKVTHMMQQQQIDAEAVVDEDDHILGEISCNHLFRRGIPAYMKELTTVPAIKNFNPFEDYFTADAKMPVREVMYDDYAQLTESATLLEVVFLLSVKMYPKVYVCREGRKVGSIDRITVLDRLLNL